MKCPFNCSFTPFRFPGNGVANLHHHPLGSVFSTAYIHLPLRHGSPQPQTSTRHHWPSGRSYGELMSPKCLILVIVQIDAVLLCGRKVLSIKM